jgi:nucleoside-diphosphate-sugar epimerase
MNNKTLLLIGGSGFIGRTLLDFILTKENTLRISKIIILSRGNFKFKIKNNFKKNFLIKFIYADIKNITTIPFAHYVIYAAVSGDYKKNFSKYDRGVRNYFKLAKKYHSKSKILYISSGAVYGQQPKKVKKLSEEYLFSNKRINFKNKNKNFYSLIKIKNEKFFIKLSKLKIQVAIARCFAFVGKYLPLDKHFVVGNYINNILVGKKILVKSNHEVIRSFMHEYDLSRWLLKIVQNAKIDCPVYNVGSDEKIQIRKLALHLSNKYKVGLKLKKINSNFEDRYLPSVLKAKKILKLKLNYNNLNAINDVISRIKNNKK